VLKNAGSTVLDGPEVYIVWSWPNLTLHLLVWQVVLQASLTPHGKWVRSNSNTVVVLHCQQ